MRPWHRSAVLLRASCAGLSRVAQGLRLVETRRVSCGSAARPRGGTGGARLRIIGPMVSADMLFDVPMLRPRWSLKEY